jgi:choline dehydrogenase
VRLSSSDPIEPLELDLGFLSDPEAADLAVIVDGAGLVRRFAATDVLGRLLAAEARPGAGVATREQLEGTSAATCAATSTASGPAGWEPTGILMG